MNRRKLAVSVLLSLTRALGASGCQSPSPEETPPAATATASAAAAAPVWPSYAGKQIRIALCTSPDSVDDHFANAACYNAVISFIVSRDGLDSITPLQETTGDPFTVRQAYGNATASYDVMVCVGPTFSGFASVAQAHPDKQFILVDVPCTDESGTTVELDNVCSIQFAEQECGFYAGVAAAMETQTGRVAVITDYPNVTSQRYYYGFRSGVAYANGNLGTAADVIDHPSYAGVDAQGNSLGGNYTSGKTDVAQALANSLADEGCDVLFAADASYLGVFAAARAREGVKVIGSCLDRFSDGANGVNTVTHTSVTKDNTGALGRVLATVADGTFQGGAYTLGAADDATRCLTTEGSHQLSADTLAALEAVRPMMQDGTIVPGSGPQ